jgi:hypothetical protein
MSRPLWWIRRGVKDLIVWVGLGPMLIEYCDDCGIRVRLVWWADDALWHELTSATHGEGVFCPRCFDRRAERRRILLRWTPTVEIR